MEGLLIYGANGYTGRLVARRATEAGLRPVLAGRDAQAVAAIARELDLPWRTFELRSPDLLAAGVAGARVVLNCAGPFVDTAEPLVEACLAARIHYLDVTGEASVLQALHARDDRARQAGVLLLPGAGFDVVPGDCLAASLAARLPQATRLELAFLALGGVSRGTALTALRHLFEGGLVCRGGELVRVRAGRPTRDVDFGRGPVRCVALPWGDVVAARASTGIADITCYGVLPRRVRRLLPFAPLLAPLLRRGPLRHAIERRIRRGPPGPDAAARAAGRGHSWGEATGPGGARVSARLSTPDGYEFTSHAAVALAVRALHAARGGCLTPSQFAGADFVLGLPGVVAEGEWPAAAAR